MNKFFPILGVFLAIFSSVDLVAEEWYNGDFYTPDFEKVSVSQDRFVEDRISIEFMAGGVYAPIGIGPSHDTFTYSLTNIRLNWMLNTPSGNGFFLDGNFEAIIELSASYIFTSWGNVIVGPTGLVRYNFVQPGWKVVPYIQAGAGVVYTDAHEDPTQDEIGQAIEFTPQASVGLKFLADEDWSINTELIFHHISNASLSPQNDGTNALGGMVGFTYYFDKLWK
ncbi:MAG: acyloxyacyl hydrolase [Verrucomicrobiota bacterium]